MEETAGFEPAAVRFCKPFLWTTQARLQRSFDNDSKGLKCQFLFIMNFKINKKTHCESCKAYQIQIDSNELTANQVIFKFKT